MANRLCSFCDDVASYSYECDINNLCDDLKNSSKKI